MWLSALKLGRCHTSEVVLSGAVFFCSNMCTFFLAVGRLVFFTWFFKFWWNYSAPCLILRNALDWELCLLRIPVSFPGLSRERLLGSGGQFIILSQKQGGSSEFQTSVLLRAVRMLSQFWQEAMLCTAWIPYSLDAWKPYAQLLLALPVTLERVGIKDILNHTKTLDLAFSD